MGDGASRCVPRKVDVCVSRRIDPARTAFMRNRRTPTRRTRVDQEVTGPPVVEWDEYVPPGRPPLPEIWPWLLLLLLLVIGGLLAAYFLTRDDTNQSSASAVTIPALVGLKQSNVVRQLDERGLVPQLATGPSKFPAGTVFAQDPGAGTHVNRGSLVKLSISSAAQTSVPNVVGTKTSAAVSRLKAAGLQSQVITVPAKAAAGMVVKEIPAAGTRVAKASTVSLRVSKGETTVPDVRGQPASDAKAATANGRPRAGGVHGAERSAKGDGDRAEAAKQESGSRLEGANQCFDRLGLLVPHDHERPAGDVHVPDGQAAERRRPAADRRAAAIAHGGPRRPSEVRLVAEAVRPGRRPEPDDRNDGQEWIEGSDLGFPRPERDDRAGSGCGRQDQQSATSTLQNAGFQIQMIMVPASDPSQNGIVVDEQPAGGTRAPDGSTVTIYVGSSG
jgi:beta-lactam-binding protein with PASTA domain